MTIVIILFTLLAIVVIGCWVGRREPAEIPEDMPAADQFALADELQTLLDLPLESEADVKAWYRACHAAEEPLHSPRFAFPEYVYHWFSDADIRFKDLGYREKQDSQIKELIGRYRAGTDVIHADT